MRSPVLKLAAGTTLVGAALLAVTFLTDRERAIFAYLTAYVFVTSVAVGALLFVAIAHATGAGWMAVLRRRAEDVTSVLPLLVVLFCPIALGIRALYPWARPPGSWTPELREQIVPKLAYLNTPFFLGRALLYLGSWALIAEALRRASRKQDTSSSPALGETQRTVAAASLPWLGLTLTFAAFDWLMSLDPAWHSSVFGIYLFAGAFGAAVGLLSFLVFGPLPCGVRVATPEHAHALGRLLLTFVIFWAYIAFVQYLLVWIADLPDEIPWVRTRTTGAWGAVAVALVVIHFVLPFGALLSRGLKRQPIALSLLGGWAAVAHYLDTYWVVIPHMATGPRPHVADLGALLFLVGAATFTAILRSGTEDEIARQDPAVVRGLGYEAAS